MTSTGHHPWKENWSEDHVRPGNDDSTATEKETRPGISGEARRREKKGGETGDGGDVGTHFDAGRDGDEEVKESESRKEDDEEVEEVRKPKIGRIPKAPTKRELEEHLPLHIPYKAWCPICVSGEGIHNQARKTVEGEGDRLGVTISFDYCFLTSEGEADEDPKILIMHDDKLETLWALGVQQKGVTIEVVTWIMQKLEEAGYKGVDLTLKTDQEESIMALKRAVAARREARTSMIESKVRVSASNPRVERAVRKWRGQFRKLKMHLESRIKRKVPPDHLMVPWLIHWAGDVVQKFHVRSDGRTAYEDMTKHRVKHFVIGFGEKVQFLLATDNTPNKYEGEWQEGFFVGVVSRSSEYLVIKGDEVYKCPTVRRLTDEDAYTAECLQEIRANFFEYIKKGATTSKTVTYKGEIKGGITPKTVDKDAQPRSVRIRATDLDKHGLTAGCPGCAWHTDKIGPHRGHTAQCRNRLENAMSETEEGKTRMGIAKARKEKYQEEKKGGDEAGPSTGEDKTEDKPDEQAGYEPRGGVRSLSHTPDVPATQGPHESEGEQKNATKVTMTPREKKNINIRTTQTLPKGTGRHRPATVEAEENIRQTRRRETFTVDRRRKRRR